MTARRAVQGLALSRVAIGATLVVAPERVTEGWIGRDAERPGARVLGRAVGMRDLALGAGALVALRRGDSAWGWLAGAAAADAADFGATVAAGRRLPALGRYAVPAIAGGSAVMHVALGRVLRTV